MTTPQKYSESIKAFEKAEDAIQNAEYDLMGDFFLAVANRSYYTCYYSMIALLYAHNIYAKTHKGLRTKFSEVFIKAGIFPAETSEIISILFDYRQQADYDLDSDITFDEAKNLIKKAKKFYDLTKSYFQELIEKE